MNTPTMIGTRLHWPRLAVLACVAAGFAHGGAFADRMSAPAFREALGAVAGYAIEEGEPAFTEELRALDQAVIAAHGDEALRAAYAEALATFLVDEDTTLDAKWFAARQLYRIAGPGQVPVIAPLLTDETTSDAAIYALQDIPGEAATQALVNALRETEGTVRIGIINALAERGDPAALPVLNEFAPVLSAEEAAEYSADERALIEAALQAIAAIGGPEAQTMLMGTLLEIQQDPHANAAPRDFFLPYAHAWLTLQARAERPGMSVQEMGHGHVLSIPAPQHVQTAATLAVFRIAPQLIEDPMEVMESTDLGKEVKWAILWQWDNPAALEKLAEGLLQLPREYHAMTLEILAERGIPAAAQPAAQLARSPLPDTRVVALQALGKVGGVNHIGLLLESAADANADFARAARQSLVSLKGDDINQAIARSMRGSDPPLRAAALEILAARQATDQLDTFWTATEHDSELVRVAAYEALSVLGGTEDAIRMAKTAMQTPNMETRMAAGEAMVRIARRTGTQGAVARASLDYLEQDASAPTAPSAIATLGRLDDPAVLPVLVDATQSHLPPVQLAAIRALSDWPTGEAYAPLLELAKARSAPSASDTDGVIGTLALRGAIGLVPKLEDASGQLAAYQEILTMNVSDPDTRRVVAGLAQLSGPEALALAESFLDDENFANDARFAVSRIRINNARPAASHRADDAGNAVDSDAGTRWTTGELQRPGQWFQLSFDAPAKFSGVVLNNARSPNDFPRGYAIRVSQDGEAWGEPIATGAGSEGITRIEFEPVTAGHIRVEQTGSADEHFWSIHSMEIQWHDE